MVQSTRTIRPLRDAQIQKVCSLSGIQGKLYSRKLIELKDLEAGLAISLKEAEAAVADESFWGKALVTAKLVKVACDVTLDILSDFAGPGGKAVSMIYDRASLVVDGLNGTLDGKKMGQHVAEIHIDALSLGLEYMGKNQLGLVVGKSKMLIKAQLAIDEIIVDMKANQSSGVASAQRTMLVQFQRVRGQIADLEAELEKCRPVSLRFH